MNQIIDFFVGLFDTSLWPPRWHCGRWSEFHGWLYIISDLLIFSAYFAMPVIIVRFIVTKTNSRFHKIYFLFAAFILACGFTHLLDAITFWYPVYRFNALVRFITGIISWATVYQLIKILPIAFTLKTARDLEVEVEHRIKAEEELKVKIKLLNEAQEIAKMGHWEWNPETNTFLISDNLFRIYELKPHFDTITYDQFLGCIHSEDRDTVRSLLQKAISDKNFNEFYYRIPILNGDSKTIHMKGEVITNDNFDIQKIVGTSQDVSQQKNTEQELLVKSNQLEAKNDELQKFAYIASHDLQEPLRKIRTFVSRLQDPADNSTIEKGKVYMDKIENAASRMQSLIDDILNFSRISSDDSSLFEKTDLNAILQEVLNDLEIGIENNKVRIKTGNLPIIDANASQMRQLFQNLISNAIKFRRSEVTSEISIHSSFVVGAAIDLPERVKAHYRFSGWKENRSWDMEKFAKLTITDNGIGFNQEYSERIFEAFQRLSRSYEGTGIGLAICKKIVETHHGVISVTSTAGEGTTFTIILPASQLNFA